MATDPQFATTVNLGATLVPATNDASFTAPTHVATLLTGGTNGSKIEEIRAFGVGTTVAGRLNLFAYNGTTYYLVDEYLVTAVTPSATQEVYNNVVTYQNLVLPNNTWTLVVTVMEAGNESLISVSAFGGNF